MPKYSIVVPLHNEQENVTDLYDRLKAVMEAHGETFEIVLVDDGHGPDDLLHLIVEIKGYRREDAKEKKSTMDTYWVPCSYSWFYDVKIMSYTCW